MAMLDANATPVNLALNGCARCGESHDKVKYRVFVNPIPDPGGDFTHWAPCPTNGDPILMRWITDPDEITDSKAGDDGE